MMTFDKKLSLLLSESPLSQSKLGELVGVHQTQISRWARGDGSPTLAQAAKLADALKVSIDFLGRDDVEEPDPSLSPEESLILKVVRRIGPVDVLESLIVGGVANSQSPSDPPDSGKGPRYWKGVGTSATYRRKDSGPHSQGGQPVADESAGEPI